MSAQRIRMRDHIPRRRPGRNRYPATAWDRTGVGLLAVGATGVVLAGLGEIGAGVLVLALAVTGLLGDAIGPLHKPSVAPDDIRVDYHFDPDRQERVATERRIRVALRSAPRFDAMLGHELAGLARERLRLRRGIIPEHDPAAARQLLGDALWGLVDPAAGAVRVRPTRPAQLADMLERLERL